MIKGPSHLAQEGMFIAFVALMQRHALHGRFIYLQHFLLTYQHCIAPCN